MPAHQQANAASLFSEGLGGPAYITTMEQVNERIFSPPCECDDCQHGFYAAEEQIRPNFWYSGSIMDDEASALLSNYIAQAEGDRQCLLKYLSSHGDIVLSRWKKKSKEKRRELLIRAIPELCEERWIIPRYCCMPESKTGGLVRRPSKRRYQLLQHWLSLEVLKSNPAVLFALLRNRSVYAAQDWATFDGRQLILSWACGHFDNQFNGRCVVMYSRKYGELVDWEPGPAHRADVIGLPKARLILEGQAKLMRGLRKIVESILEGVDLNQTGSSEKWQQMTNHGFRHSGELELWSPYTNQAFSSPPVFSIDNIISIAQTRLEAAADHLWFLQTDIPYMRRHIKTIHQGEFSKAIKKDAAGAVLTTAIFDEVESYWRWSWLKDECEYVKSVYDRFTGSIYPGQALPAIYDRALGALELLIVNEVLHRARHIGTILPQRPGFSYKWIFEWRPEVSPTSFHLQRRHGEPTDQSQLLKHDPLEWCLSQMQAEPDKQTNYDHAIMFAFLENYLATCSSSEKKRVDEVLHRTLSDLAACHEILVSVRLHRPQNVARDLEEVRETETRIAWKAKSIPGYLTHEDIIESGAALLRDFQNAPLPGGKKDAMWAERTKSLRGALETFWERLRRTPRLVFVQSGFTENEVDECLKIVSASLTPEYSDIVKEEERDMLVHSESGNVLAKNTVQNEWGTSTVDEGNKVMPPSPKQKRRLEKAASESVVDNLPVAGLNVQSRPKAVPIWVKKRAFDMISLMFPQTGAESSKGMDWDPFVLAMTDIGFLARNVGGSAVMFEKDAGEQEGSVGGRIVFHKPHPVSKIDPVMLHSMGKRMWKWFNWERNLFVLDT